MSLFACSNDTELTNALATPPTGNDVIELEVGVTFSRSSTTLPGVGTRAAPVTIRSAGYDNWGKHRFSRAQLADVADMATIGINGSVALQGPQTTPGGWEFLGLNFANTNTASYRNSGLYYGLDNTNSTTPTALSQLSTLVIRHCVFNDCANVQFPIVANCGSAIIESNYIGPISAPGYESKCLAGWSCFGPFLVQNNTMSGATIGMLMGGATNIIGHVPKGIFRCNHVYWDTATHPGGKNLYEHKEGQGWLIEGNVFEHFWVDGQYYPMIYNIGLDDPSHCERMTARFNYWKNCETWAGAGYPSGSSVPWRVHTLVYHDNLVEAGADPRDNTNSDQYLLSWHPMLKNVLVHHNTVVGMGTGTKTSPTFTAADNLSGTGQFTFRDNIVVMGWGAGLGYMIIVSGVGYNKAALDSLYGGPGGSYSFTNNAICREDTVSHAMPTGNDYYTGGTRVADMLAKLNADFSVKASQTGTDWNTYGSDGGRIGCDVAELNRRIAGVEDGEPTWLQSGAYEGVVVVGG